MRATIEFPSGLRVLFDPVFEACCLPVQIRYNPNFVRYTEPACLPADLPAVDAVVISHSHYDHLSYPSVKAIVQRHPAAHFFVPLGLERWFRSVGIVAVTEMDWWQDAEMVLERTAPGSSAAEKAGDGAGAGRDDPLLSPARISATLTCLPCQHASARGPFDRDQTLWATWAVSSGAKSLWFGGDTGYRRVTEMPEGAADDGPGHAHLPRNPDFALIGQHRGPFDLGLIPIGAYEPRYLFSSIHASPRDAVEIFADTGCRHALGMHWGTWTMGTSEDVNEPPKMLKEALRKRGLPETGLFDVCAIGESREY